MSDAVKIALIVGGFGLAQAMLSGFILRQQAIFARDQKAQGEKLTSVDTKVDGHLSGAVTQMVTAIKESSHLKGELARQDFIQEHDQAQADVIAAKEPK